MNVNELLHMTGGEGKTSYANNSQIQRTRIAVSEPFIEDAILKFFDTKWKRFNVADMGCSSGPNSLIAVYKIVDAVYRKCQSSACPYPEIHVFLNDLFGNDFNTLFKFIPSFHEKLRKEKDGFGSCFVSATPGSFYDRLFPSESMHFVYSNSSLHWLSQVPLGLAGVNRGNINLGRTSPPVVYEAYLAQFQKDFNHFLKSRSEELATGGCMVLSLSGRSMIDPFAEECRQVWNDIASALSDLVEEGVVEEAKLDSFNVPYYAPHIEEVSQIIQEEGSFQIIQLVEAPHTLTPHNLLASHTRAALEPMLACHFGQVVMDKLFLKFEEKVSDNSHKTLHLVAVLVRKSMGCCFSN